MTGARAGLIGIAIGALAAALVLAVVMLASPEGEDPRLAERDAALAAAERRIRDLEAVIAERDAALAAMKAAPQAPGPVASAPPVGIWDHEETAAPTEVLAAVKGRFNRGVTQPSSRFMVETLGHPREDYSQDCQPVTNPRLRSRLVTGDIGGLRITMLAPALESLKAVLAGLEADEPDLFAKLGTAGALCARNIRGSATAVSNHSWGTAIDLTLEGKLDRFADGATQFGLFILAERFNAAGWYWGAGYGREDSMHFEAGAELVAKWVAEGLL